MTDQTAIGTAFARTAKALSKRPSGGQSTETTSVHLRDGLTCEIESGPWKLQADMPENVGGSGTAPKPGVLQSAALGSCEAIAIAMWAARDGVPIDELRVDVEVDRDARGLFGVGDEPARWRAVRYVITVESTAPDAEVRRVIKAAMEHSPMGGNLEHGFRPEHELKIVAPAG